MQLMLDQEHVLTLARSLRANAHQCLSSPLHWSSHKRRRTFDCFELVLVISYFSSLPGIWGSPSFGSATAYLLITEKNNRTRPPDLKYPLFNILFTLVLDVQTPWAALVSISVSLSDLKTKYLVYWDYERVSISRGGNCYEPSPMISVESWVSRRSRPAKDLGTR